MVLRIIAYFNSHLRHFFLKLYRLRQTNINTNCTLFLSVRQKREDWKPYHFYKQHILTVVWASMYVMFYLRHFFNWSAQQINNDKNCIFLLSSCQNQIEIDRSKTPPSIHFIETHVDGFGKSRTSPKFFSLSSLVFFPITFVIFKPTWLRDLILPLPRLCTMSLVFSS